MIIKNNSRIGLPSLGMISPTLIVTPIPRTFVGPLLLEERKGTTSTGIRMGESSHSHRVTRCPTAMGHGGRYTYNVPAGDAAYQPPVGYVRKLFMLNSDMPYSREMGGYHTIDRPWKGTPYTCPLPGGEKK